MNITFEMLCSLILVIATLFCGFAWICSKLDAIRADIAKLDKSSVSHDICKQRRSECPCTREIDEIREELRRQNL